MSELFSVQGWAIGACVVVLLLSVTLLRRPLGKLFQLLGRTAAGLVALLVLQPISGLIGVTLGINLINALILGVLGAPGFALLLMLNWVLSDC